MGTPAASHLPFMRGGADEHLADDGLKGAIISREKLFSFRSGFRSKERSGTAVIAMAVLSLLIALAFTRIQEASAPSGFVGNRPGANPVHLPPATPDQRDRATNAYGSLPLQFEVNEGQSDARVKFLARGSGYKVFLTNRDVVLALNRPTSLRPSGPEHSFPGSGNGHPVPSSEISSARAETVVKLRLLGGKPFSKVEGQEQLPGKVNYFIGEDSTKWRSGIATYAKVHYSDVYPGVDLVYYGNQGQLEYDLVVAPGKNPNVIQLEYEGPKNIRVDAEGNLVVNTEGGDLLQLKPRIYQIINGETKTIDGAYAISGRTRFGFKIQNYDHSQPLVIDPILSYSTYLGGNGFDQGLGIALDSGGNAYVTGSVASTNFPNQGPIQISQTSTDAFVSKLNSSGTALVYSTYLGGVAFDQANGIAVDVSGNAYITGRTDSFNFPVTSAIQAAKSGSPFFKTTNAGTSWSSSSSGLAGVNNRDVVINPITPSTIYTATELGVYKTTNSGNNWAPTGLFSIFIEALAINPVAPGTVYAAGGGVFKTTDGGVNWSPVNNGLLVNGSVPIINALAIDPASPATLYVGASNGGVFKTIDAGSNWTTVNVGLTVVSGGSTIIPTVTSVVIDPTNPATVYAGTNAGVYRSTNAGANWIPVNSGLPDTSITVVGIDPSTPAILYAASSSGVFKSNNGGNSWINSNTGLGTVVVNALMVDPTNSATVYAATSTGVFKSINGGANWSAVNNGLTNLVINSLAIDKTTPANVYVGAFPSSDGFVTKLNFAGSALLYSTFLGGTEFDQGNGIALDSLSAAHIAGETTSANFPTANARQPASGGSHDGFVTKLNPAGTGFAYSTYLGGNSTDQARAIAVDISGNSYVTGNAFSTNFPIANAMQPAKSGDYDAFVTKLNSTGSGLFYSTYLGGSLQEVGRAIAVDGANNAYVTGETFSTNFPTANAIQPANGGGMDAYVSKLTAAGTSFVYSTYLGGISSDQAFGIAVDPNADNPGRVYVTGYTASANFPTRSPYQPVINVVSDAFVTKFNAGGSAHIYSTFLGGNSTDQGRSVAADSQGNTYVTGLTFSTNFPTSSPFQSFNRGSSDAFVAKLSPSVDLSITMLDSPDPVTLGSNLTYSIAVTAGGELNATGVVVTDSLPAGVSFVSANASQGSCNQSTGTVTCNLGNLNNGVTANITIVVIPSTVGTIINVATVSSNEFEGNVSNNIATQSTNVNPADLSVTLTDSPDPVDAGANLTYTIVVRNNGPQQAQNVVLTDTLPPGVTFGSANSTQGSCSQTVGAVTCNLGSLANGATATTTIVVSATRGTITNTASVTSNNPDPNIANNTAFQTTDINGSRRNPDTRGTDFWLTFEVNYIDVPALSLFITSDVNTQGTVSIPGSGFSTNFSVTAGLVSTVIIPADMQAKSSDGIENKGIHLTALDEVSVYGLNRFPQTTDAYLALPVKILGTSYMVMSYGGGYGSQFAVVGTVDSTTVTITPSSATSSRAAGVPYNVVLNEGQVYQLINTIGGDLTGSIVTANKPIAVFGGNGCVSVPAGFGFCDHLVEQLTPNETWGKNFVTMPLATRLLGDTFRFLASTNGTTVSVNGSVVATLNRGQFHERIINGPAQITSNQPILVAQYSNGTQFDGVTSDPFMMLVPPFEQFLDKYTVTTPATGFTLNFINVVLATGGVGSITLDGNPVPPGSFVPIGSSGFSGAQLSVSSGSHRLAGAVPFGAFVYGFASFDSYGYPGGLSLSPIASVASLTLTPKTSTANVMTQHCKIATVKDQNNNPLADIRVDFIVTGPNQTAGFAVTNLSGMAQFCYTGATGGIDTIVASVGNISDNATHTWSALGISGRVTDAGNNGISGVTVTLSGSQTGNTITDTNGNYTLGGLTQGGSYVVTPSKAGTTFTPPSQSFNTLSVNQTANFTGTATLTISGRVMDEINNGINGVQVTLSGTLTRVIRTDAAGNFSFGNLVGGGNYSVVATGPLYIFAPPRFDFTNLLVNQTANFMQVPGLIPPPNPPFSDDFNSGQRDPEKWNLGTATQPAGAFDPQIPVVQSNGQLVISPRANVAGPHYNGYVSVKAFDLTGGNTSVEMVQPASGGAETIFSIGKDNENFCRFVVRTAGGPSSPTMLKGPDGVIRRLDTTSAQLLLQVKIAGQLTTLPFPYDPVQHHHMRFRHEPSTDSILFETSPIEINYTIRLRQQLEDKLVSAENVELSAGTADPLNPGQARFDNLKLVTSTFRFSASGYSGGENESSVTITVLRTSPAESGKVNFATSDGTAHQGAKYVTKSGTLTFAAGEESKSFTISLLDNTQVDGNQTVNLTLDHTEGSSLDSPGRAILTIVDNDGGPQFSTGTYSISEGGGSVQAVVNRSDTTAAVSVNYATSDSAGLSDCSSFAGKASSRCDYATSRGTLRFAAGEGSKTILIPIVDDVYAEGNETLNLTLSNPVGTLLANQATATVTLQDNETVNGVNPIDGVDFFIRQNYIDFLGREPDAAGLAGWRNVLNNCGTSVPPPCDRIEVSAGFFRSEEFQSRGYFIYRFYSAVGRIPVSEDFMPDFAKLSGFLTAQQLEANKVAYVDEFMARTEFQTKYGPVLNNPQAFIDALLQTVGLSNHPSKAGWISGLQNNSLTRAQVLRQLVDSSEVYTRYYNEAFVIMQYFGYLRRTADGSYLNWIQTMTQTGGDYRIMINGFMNSVEYRRRFGP